MTPRAIEIAVLGAGLSGLAAAHALRERNLEVFEASDRVGGRTLSEDRWQGVWANFGAQYITPDKTHLVELADELSVELVGVAYEGAYARARRGLAAADAMAVEATIARLEAEQAQARDPTSPELDQRTFAGWLGDQPPGALLFWEDWCHGLACASTIHTSLIGAMWLWGPQRTTPWSGAAVPTHSRGDCVVAGGTSRLAEALAKSIGSRVRLRSRVVRVRRGRRDFEVLLATPGGELEVRARRVVCALPAPLALEVVEGLPAWKRDALGRARYGRYITTPLTVAAASGPRRELELSPSRAGQAYNSNHFAVRTTSNLDRDGGCFHAWLDDRHARTVWDDPDESIRSGVQREFLGQWPEFQGRVHSVGVQRWRHGLPGYYPGRMRDAEALAAAAAGIEFCGDYTNAANMEGAVRSGQRAAAAIAAS